MLNQFNPYFIQSMLNQFNPYLIQSMLNQFNLYFIQSVNSLLMCIIIRSYAYWQPSAGQIRVMQLEDRQKNPTYDD